MLMDQTQEALNRGALAPAVASDLLTTAYGILAEVPATNEHSEIVALRAEASLMLYDAYIGLGARARAVQSLETATALANQLLAGSQKDAFQHLLYRIHFRKGDVLAGNRPPDSNGAEEEYRRALKIIEELAARPPGSKEFLKDAAFINGKIGDLFQMRGMYREALAENGVGLSRMEHAVAGDGSSNPIWLRDYASAKSRVGQAHNRLREFDLALENFQSALATRLSLHEQDKDNAIIQTHVASSLREVAETLLKLRRVDEAIAAYKREALMRRTIASSDPFNPNKQAAVARTLERIGDSLAEHKVPQQLDFYEQALEIWTRLVLLNPDDTGWHGSLAAMKQKIAGLKART
jgi:tetratricopeptide (TPR) repeat protein